MAGMSAWPGDWPAGYSERPAPPALRDVLACTWAQVIPAGQPSSVLVLPDGCTDLAWERGQGASIAGPDTGPVPTPLRPGTVILGVRFRPGAGGPLLGLPLCELRDQRVPLTEVHRRLARELPGTLDPGDAQARLLTGVARLRERSVADAAVLHAARLLGGPAARTHTAAAVADLSDRQFRRRWQAAVGYGPKTFQQVLRFRQFVSRLDAAGPGPRVSLATLAWETGYADQAHLTRACTRFAGVSPAVLARLRRGGLPGPFPERPRHPGKSSVR
jgi:AraC-like DNA-binding protein